MTGKRSNVVALLKQAGADDTAPARRVRLVAIEQEGLLRVQGGGGREFLCDCLEWPADVRPLALGDTLLALAPQAGDEFGVVLGRLGRYRTPQARPQVTVEATESLSLKCGDASIELRADGKLMVKGEDVLVKARGTQRIKAGSVNIN